jgi:hypothetical protein
MIWRPLPKIALYEAEVKPVPFPCRCSMIMSVVNWSEKMSVWEDERETDIESGRAEAVVGNE